MNRLLLNLLVWSLLISGGAGQWLVAQDGEVRPPEDNNLPAVGLAGEPGGFGGLGDFGAGAGQEIALSGEFKIAQGGRTGILQVKARLAPGWHTYAIEQQGGPGPSKITVHRAEGLELTGPFRPDREPQKREVKYFDVPLLEHYDQVVWSAPVRLAEGVAPEQLAVELKFDGQACDDAAGCKPIFGQIIPVKFAGSYASVGDPQPEPKAPPIAPSFRPTAPLVSGAGYRAPSSHATIRGSIEPKVVTPGGTLRLTVTATCEPDWHIYAYATKDPEEIAKPTLIVLSEPASWTAEAVQASAVPTVQQILADEPAVRFHGGTVSWTMEIRVPETAEPGDHALSGVIGYQTCTDTGCDPPAAASFAVTATVGQSEESGRVPLVLTAAKYSQAAKLAAGGQATTDEPQTAGGLPVSPPASGADPTKTLQIQGESQATLGAVLLLAFVGGLVLNIMPCVLPVIGLKIMSFVQQAGESRGRVFALNLWYVLGILAVFLVLATLAVVTKSVSWGEHFGSEAFAITMAVVVFVMGLSFLGVWEIPIPGFAGSGTAAELASREGPLGAFMKGIITTLLATPCSGPGIGVAVAYCAGQPASVIYLIFTVLGLGMASPYLIIGANPKLIRFLPKPGIWMETAKQMLGFLLLGTVVFLLSFMRWTSVLPTIALLFGCWAACWWIGRIAVTAEFQTRLRGWLVALAGAGLVGVYAFGDHVAVGGYELYGLRGVMESRMAILLDAAKNKPLGERIADLARANKTVLVDFTADWCLTCKTLEATVLNTEEVRAWIRDNGVETLVADWTKGDAEVTKVLESLGSKQVPVVAIFPAGKPNAPFVLRGFYTKAELLDKLRQAGPSRDATPKRPGGPA